MKPRLVRRMLLDPRGEKAAAAKPIDDAVNIPCSELPGRTHELPAKHRMVRVAATSPVAEKTVAWLNANRRRGELARDFGYAAEPLSPDVGRLWEPNALLAEVLPQLPPGTALDIACGSGRDAVFMSACGWEVTGLDVLADALARARDLAVRCAPAIGPIRWIEADVETEDGLMAATTRSALAAFDGAFDLITGFRYLHRPLFRRFREWLRPGGSVVYETFTTRHGERHGKPARAAHLLKPGELRALLDGFEVRRYEEGWHDDAHTARVWAVRK